ncbi:VOC family protein [Pedobacter nyackensis]|uniref:Catechol-2,3-dioxygenase n=1 Tax=Pedobacter nyackensis TaxID=475255 RepID=A0A1W2ELJ1_9SPHI|nr:VOC family protein [Pedobacter nyackensis]SMD09998.1 Catechol-2,3-dioxygenase [Pedobacter nyackensis]
MNIEAIEICTTDIRQTELFYTEVLNFRLLEKNKEMISFVAGDSVLTFRSDEHLERPIYHFAFNIPNNQLKEAIEWLNGRVYLLTVDKEKDSYVADFSSWNANAIYFQDNNGNILEFIVRYDLDDQSEFPFTGQSITCISEIGLVTDDVYQCIRTLTASHDIQLFTKQAPQPRFAALGDDHGLLILSETGRDWFPTTIPARKFPLKIMVSTEQEKFNLLLNQK